MRLGRDIVKRRQIAGDGHAHAGIGPVGDHRCNLGRVKYDFPVEDGVRIAAEFLPCGDSLVPVLPLRRIIAALEVSEGNLVRGDEAAAGAHLDGQVTKRQATFHGQGPDSGTGVLHKVARRTTGGELAHKEERHVLGGHALPEGAFDADPHRLGLLLQDALRSQDHLHLGSADTERHGADGAMRGRMRVTADDGHARQGQALLRSHDVDDAVVRVHHPVVREPELGGVGREGVHLLLGNRVLDGPFLALGRGIVVRHADNLLRTQAADAPLAQAVERLRARHLVAVEPVDVQLVGPAFHVLDDVRIPDFVKEGVHTILLIQST